MNQAMNPTEPLKPNTNGMLRLFVYGTLKRVSGTTTASAGGPAVETPSSAAASSRNLRHPVLGPGISSPSGPPTARRRGHTARVVAACQSRATRQLRRRAQRALGPRVWGASDLDDPKTAFRPSTGWRGFIPAVPASTAASWSLSGQTEPGSRSGSMRWGIAGPGASRS